MNISNLWRRPGPSETEPFKAGLGEWQGRVAVSEFFNLEAHEISGYVIVAMVRRGDEPEIGVISSKLGAWPWAYDLLDSAMRKVRAASRADR